MPNRYGRGAGGTNRKGHRMISRSTIAAATRVIQYAAARPIVLSPGLMPSSKAAAQSAEVGNADGLGAIAAQAPLSTGA